jgi:DNA-binding SARP family transcriptional activator
MARLVLAMLTLRPNVPVSREELAAQLWPERPPPSSAANLRSYLAELRRLTRGGQGLGIEETPGRGVRLCGNESTVDALRFDGLAACGRRALATGQHQLAEFHLGQALALWRGRVAEGLELPDGSEPEARRLEEARLGVVEDWVQARLGQGDHVALVAEVRGLVARHGLRERLWRQLMLALYRSGRTAEALMAYQELAALLDRELGARPHPDTRQLRRAIQESDPRLPCAGLLSPPGDAAAQRNGPARSGGTAPPDRW